MFKKLEIISDDTMNSIAITHACTFLVLDLNKVMAVTWRRYKSVVMLWVFHLMKTNGIGKPFLDKEQKKKVKSITVKFKSWKACAAFYKAR